MSASLSLLISLSQANAGQVGLSQVGAGQLGLVLYSLLFSIIRMPHSINLFMCFIKTVQQKSEGIMLSGIYILGLSILTILAYSTDPTS